MENDKIKELLIKVRDYILNYKCEHGLCQVTALLWRKGTINIIDMGIIDRYLRLNRPGKPENPLGFWWPPMYKGQEYINIRVEFLNKLINEL